jgi:hypothetical protein
MRRCSEAEKRLRAARNLSPSCRVASYRAGSASRMGRSDDYRRYAKECLDMATTVQDAKSRASLLQMAQVWLRLAQTHDAKRESDKRQSDQRQCDHGGE